MRALFGEQTNRLREVWAHGRSHDDQAEAIGGANEKRVVDAKVSCADVERAAFAMRNPIAVEADEFLDAFEEERLGNFRHGEARRGTIYAAEIFARSEQRDAAVSGAMRLEA